LSTENLSDYVFIEINFGEITHDPSTRYVPVINGKKEERQYITCLATITVKPRADYSFTNASVKLKIDVPQPWKIAHVKNSLENYAPNAFPSWEGTINLDKNGYGEKTIFLYCYNDYFEEMHPANYKITQEITSASGKLKKN
jgi:hypothetical protein